MTLTIDVPDQAVDAHDAERLRTAADALLGALSEAGLDDPRWEWAGQLVTAAAQLLREALGTPVQVSPVFVPAVVREADFASATRPLLAEPVVVDAEAARVFVALADEAALAFG